MAVNALTNRNFSAMLSGGERAPEGVPLRTGPGMSAQSTRIAGHTTVNPSAQLRIAVHDYSGHPFQIQLSRELARRGHDVLHLYSTAFQTPKGPLGPAPSDPLSFRVEGIDLGETFQKYSFTRRLLQERQYGRLLAERVMDYRPDVLISTNTPLDAQAIVHRRLHGAGIRYVFWLQDLYSSAIERMLRRRLPLIGPRIARRFSRLEARLLRESDAVVAITDDFLPALSAWSVSPDRTFVIENWAPLDRLAPLEKVNPWSRQHGIADKPVFMYAGTLGLKHDPSMLLELAQNLPDSKVVVVSEGIGADWLRERGTATDNLLVLPFQPFDRLSEVLASADVLVAILEPDAGAYSVPSKVLTSLAAGKPILGAISPSNLAAKTIERAGAGIVVSPGDLAALVSAGRSMMGDAERRQAFGRAARAYAEATFDIGAIADRFESIVHGTAGESAPHRSARPNRSGRTPAQLGGDS